jgi:O-antigen/teichoic acid export membrane protein
MGVKPQSSPRVQHLIRIASFALGTGSQAALGFLSIPLLVRILGVEELGRWSIVEAVFQIGAQVALLGFNQTLIKFISADGLAPGPSLLKVAKTLLPVVTLAALVVAIAAHFWLNMSASSAAAVGLLLCLECWIVLGLSTSRAASKPLVFSAALIMRGGGILLALFLAVYVLPSWIRGASDVVWVWNAVYLLVAALLAFALLQVGASGRAPDRLAMTQGMRYGAPLLIAVLLAQLLQYADRFFVASELGYAEAGRYFVHAKVANALAMAALPVQLWWPVARFEHLKDADGGGAFFSRASLVGVVFFSFTLLALALIAPLVFHWFAPAQPLNGWLLFLLLSALFVQVSTVFFNIGLLDAGSTHLNVVVWGVTAMVQLGLQALLVPRLGALGAALGLFAGALCALALQYTLSQRRKYIRFPVGALIAMALATLLCANLLLLHTL